MKRRRRHARDDTYPQPRSGAVVQNESNQILGALSAPRKASAQDKKWEGGHSEITITPTRMAFIYDRIHADETTESTGNNPNNYSIFTLYVPDGKCRDRVEGS